MELANKYQWTSVLKYDEEFRNLQAIYGYPWSFDSNHLHETTLQHKISSRTQLRANANRGASLGGSSTQGRANSKYMRGFTPLLQLTLLKVKLFAEIALEDVLGRTATMHTCATRKKMVWHVGVPTQQFTIPHHPGLHQGLPLDLT